MAHLPPFQEWIVQLVSMISNALLGIAAVFGIFRLWQWRSELIGRSKYQLARKIVLLALQFREEYHYARGMFTFGDEAAGRERSQNETEAESRVMDEYHSRIKRLQLLQRTLRRVHEASWEADIVLKQGDSPLTKPLGDAYSDLATSIRFLFDAELKQAKSPSGHMSIKESDLRELHDTVYGVSNDPIGQKVENAVDVIKARLTKYLR